MLRADTSSRAGNLIAEILGGEFAPERLREQRWVEIIDQSASIDCVGGKALDPCNRGFESFQFGRSIGEKIPIIRCGILPEQVPRQAIDQSTYTIPHPGDRSARQPETRHSSEREIVQPAEERSGSGLAFHKLECCAEVGMSRQQIAVLARRRCKPVAPKRNVVNDRGKLRARRKVRLDPGGKDDEVECEGARLRFDSCDASAVADRVPWAVGVPHEIFEPAATPKGILGRRHRTLLQNVAHEPPSLQVSQFRKVTEHAREIHPHEWIDARNMRTAKAKVDASGTGFERGGCVVEGGSANAEHANALARNSAEIDVIGRMGITLRGKVGDKVPRSPPASAAVKAGCEDDLSRMDAFGPSGPTQMGEQKVAGRLDRCDFDLVFDWKLEKIPVPIEICSPDHMRDPLDEVLCVATVLCLVTR